MNILERGSVLNWRLNWLSFGPLMAEHCYLNSFWLPELVTVTQPFIDGNTIKIGTGTETPIVIRRN